MNGKTVLITGATSGIGKQTAIQLARTGARIVFTTRDTDRGRAALRDIVEATGSDKVEAVDCDLASFASVRSCCQSFLSRHDRLNVLINNAGLWNNTQRFSEDGIELTFAVNFLAPFLMTRLLLDRLKQSAPARIVNTTSGLHFGRIQFSDIEYRTRYSGFQAYRQSKLALILFTRMLAKKLQGVGVTVNAVAPGMVNTNLSRDFGRFNRTVAKLFSKNVEKGARTLVYAASSPALGGVTGQYLANERVGRSSKTSHDLDQAQPLWDMSVGYTGQKE